MRYMAITRKLRQKVCDGSLREMRQEAKWIFAYIRRYRAAVGIHIPVSYTHLTLPTILRV